MSTNSLVRTHSPSKKRAMVIACAGALCAASVVSSASQPGEQTEVAQRVHEIDRLTDGRFKKSVLEFKEAIDRMDDFGDYLHEHPEALNAYRRLLTDPPEMDGDLAGWGLLLYLYAGPRDILLDAWLSGIQEGGGLRPEFLRWMAKKEPRTTDIAKMLEQSSLAGEFPEPDYRLYKEYMREHPIEDAAPLIEYLLRTEPLLAMDALLESYPDQLPDAAAVFDAHWTVKKADWMYEHGMHRGEAPRETTDALNRLSRHDVWWVRLYALSAMTERGPFRLPHRVRDLRDDPNDAVNRAANAISPPEDRRDGARTRS